MTGMNDRDFVGYGRSRPRPPWRDRSPLALSLVLNYEEGAERSIQNDDATSESYIHEICGIEAREGQRDHNTESLYDYGARAGVWRILRLFEELDVTATIFGVGQALALNPEVGRYCAQQGFEVASHNWRWFDYANVPEEVEREHILMAKETIREQTGEAPVGFYCGRMSENSRRLAIECGGLLYDSDAYDDDIPYWLELEGGGRHLVIPYALDSNDMKFSTPNGFASPIAFAEYLCAAFDELYREGVNGQPAMLSVGLHCRVIGRPARLAALRRFLEHVLRHDDVWICRRADIARAYHDGGS